MNPEQDKDGIWFVMLPDGQRKTFKSNAEAWRFIDRRERQPSWVSSRRQWRTPPTYAAPAGPAQRHGGAIPCRAQETRPDRSKRQ